MRYLLIALLFTGCASSWTERDSRTLQRIADALEHYLENHDTRHNEWMIPRVPRPFYPSPSDTNSHIILDSVPGYKIRLVLDSFPKDFPGLKPLSFDSLPAYSPNLEPIGYAKFGRTTSANWLRTDIMVSRGKNKNFPDTLRLAKYSRGCIHRADGTHEYTFCKIERSGRLTYSYPIKEPKDTAGVTLYGKCH